ncbi:MAG: hypothetical protein ACR2GO_01180 [Candidatus Limnocylindria bacterium]
MTRESAGDRRNDPAIWGALAYCARPEHLRRTVGIALTVGIFLTAVNYLDVILAGEATALTGLKCAFNFVVPFIVSNLGLLSGRRRGVGMESPRAGP